MKKIIFTLLCIVVLSGCAVGNQHSYHNGLVSVHDAGKSSISVAVYDERPYIVSGRKNPDFVGLQRGGFGNPFDVTTESGRPLAHDMAEVIAKSLSASGFRASAVLSEPPEDAQSFEERLISTSVDRVLFLKILEWKADTLTNTALIYDINAYVLQGDGTILGKKHIKGRDNLGGNAWNPPKHAKTAVQNAFKKKISVIINSPKIMPALK